MDARQFEIGYGGPTREGDPSQDRGGWTTMMTSPEVVMEMAKMLYGRFIQPGVEGMQKTGAGLMGQKSPYQVDEINSPEVVQSKMVKDITDALLLYGGPGVLSGKPTAAGAGMFAGERALGANLAMKKIAEKAIAAGKNADEVAGITGWRQGMGGKWQWEFGDELSKLNLEKESSGHWNVVSGELETGFHNKKLSDVFTHPELYKNYPELKDVKINSSNSSLYGESNTRGSFSKERNMITLNSNLTLDEAKDTILHEIQHWVQGKEGFPSGTSPGYETKLAMFNSNAQEALFGTKAEEIGFNNYNRTAGEIQARDAAGRRTWDMEMRKAVPPDLREDAIIRWGGKEADEIFQELVEPPKRFYHATDHAIEQWEPGKPVKFYSRPLTEDYGNHVYEAALDIKRPAPDFTAWQKDKAQKTNLYDGYVHTSEDYSGTPGWIAEIKDASQMKDLVYHGEQKPDTSAIIRELMK